MNNEYGYDAAEKFARFSRISWKQALRSVAEAPFRLHHYRDVRTKMLHEALCDVECESGKEDR
jgi:hypothetical protein